jgi:hypothetical protein
LDNPSKPGTSLLFVYRLLDSPVSQTIYLKDLQEIQAYEITEIDSTDAAAVVSGQELQSKGVTVTLPRSHSAAILIVQAVPSRQ